MLDDPEMFATYLLAAEEARAVAEHHVAELRRQIAGIIRAGIGAGCFGPRDPATAAAAVLPFHNPHFLRDPLLRAGDSEAAAAIELLLAELRAGAGMG